MAKNNHFSTEAAERLGEKFTQQQFAGEISSIDEVIGLAAHYSKMEKSLAVLSDFKSNMSHIYLGETGAILGLGEKNATKIVPSIWEEEIFTRIPNEDLMQKHIDELKFYHFVKRQAVGQRDKYRMFAYLRMSDGKGNRYNILHRVTYLYSSDKGSIPYALCLYNISADAQDTSFILDMTEGKRIALDDNRVAQPILSDREKDVLRLISNGITSKEIADKLSISIHTVNRHRQNILEKLQSANSHEACRKAKMLSKL